VLSVGTTGAGCPLTTSSSSHGPASPLDPWHRGHLLTGLPQCHCRCDLSVTARGRCGSLLVGQWWRFQVVHGPRPFLTLSLACRLTHSLQVRVCHSLVSCVQVKFILGSSSPTRVLSPCSRRKSTHSSCTQETTNTSRNSRNFLPWPQAVYGRHHIARTSCLTRIVLEGCDSR
jgi:hypothetical protein